ncbi:hypothetical protein CR513_18324, partial [Mucuna pruriens]
MDQKNLDKLESYARSIYCAMVQLLLRIGYGIQGTLQVEVELPIKHPLMSPHKSDNNMEGKKPKTEGQQQQYFIVNKHVKMLSAEYGRQTSRDFDS